MADRKDMLIRFHLKEGRGRGTAAGRTKAEERAEEAEIGQGQSQQRGWAEIATNEGIPIALERPCKSVPIFC